MELETCCTDDGSLTLNCGARASIPIVVATMAAHDKSPALRGHSDDPLHTALAVTIRSRRLGRARDARIGAQAPGRSLRRGGLRADGPGPRAVETGGRGTHAGRLPAYPMAWPAHRAQAGCGLPGALRCARCGTRRRHARTGLRRDRCSQGGQVLILGAISGSQDFVFPVPAGGGGQARSLDATSHDTSDRRAHPRPLLERIPRSPSHPVHHQPRHPIEMPYVARDDRVAPAKRGGGDEEIRGGNPLSRRSEPGIQLAEDARDRERDGDHRHGGQHGLDEFLAPRPAGRAVRTPAPMKQFRRAHHRHPKFGIPPAFHQLGQEVRGRLPMALGMDEQRRVDQESHDGRSSTGSVANTSRRSAPKRSSSRTAERPRSTARHSDARRAGTGGGATTQTSRPWRWIRNRRPASTSSKILENERLASVADMRRSRIRLSDFFPMNPIVDCRRHDVNPPALAWYDRSDDPGSARALPQAKKRQ